jgi:hypothetical protein
MRLNPDPLYFFTKRWLRFLGQGIALTVAAIFLSAPALAQPGPEVVSIMGHAEILSAGKWRQAKTGDFIKPGDTVLVVGDGEVTLSSDGGKAEVALKKDTMASYDGDVDPNSRPWKQGQPEAATASQTRGPANKATQYTVSQGQAEAVVVPGQQLRVITPLIAAAVRGTRFIVTVAIDGSSSLSTLEGQVLAMGRNGVSSVVSAGGGFQLTSSQYATFLQQSGINVPTGDWQSLDMGALDKLDPQTLSDAASSPGSQAGTSGASSTSTSTASTPTTAASTPASTAPTTASPASSPTSAASATASTASTPATTATVTGASAASSTTGSALGNVVAQVAQVAPAAAPAAAMVSAGVATDTLAGEETNSELDNGGNPIPGTLTIINPDTNLPTDSLTTDDQGEFIMAVQGDPSDGKIVMNIGGQEYVVELELDVQINLNVTFDHYSFIDESTGRQSTATVTADFGGLTPAIVTWSAEIVQNPTAPWWLRGSSDFHGLTWGANADAASYTAPGEWGNAIMGTASTGLVAQLTDVVGSRIVRLKAETNIDGVTHSKTIDVTFGPGPLSVFTNAPQVNGSTPFARLSGNPSHAGDTYGNLLSLNPNSAADFPVSVGYCNGSVRVDSIASTTTAAPHSATFDFSPGSGWVTGDQLTVSGTSYNGYISTTSNLPSWQQLLAVAGYYSSYHGSISRKGAADAAGWRVVDNGNNGSYWTSQITINRSNGRFYNYVIALSNGSPGLLILTSGAHPSERRLATCVQ